MLATEDHNSQAEEFSDAQLTVASTPSLLSYVVPPPPGLSSPTLPAVATLPLPVPLSGCGSGGSSVNGSSQLHIVVIAQPQGMKRNTDSEAGPAPKRPRPMGDTELRFLVFSKVAGSIIGKGGSNISKLRTENHATILLPDCPGPERVLTIQGNLDSVLNVVRAVLPSLEEMSRGHTDRTGRVGDVDARLLVHQSQIGCIIGKGGAKVKELRESTGTRITVYSHCCPRSTDRIVQILGKPADCAECVKHIVTLLKETACKGPVDPYNPFYYDETFSSEYGGFGEGGGAGSGGGGGSIGGGSRRDMKIGLPPVIREVPRALSPPRSRYRESTFDHEPPLSLMGAPQPIRSLGAYREERSFREEPPRAQAETTQVSIPKDLAGAIIGKGGARIRKIRADSGASIVIDEPRPGCAERIITISGSSEQIWKAQYLLQQSVRENAQPKY